MTGLTPVSYDNEPSLCESKSQLALEQRFSKSITSTTTFMRSKLALEKIRVSIIKYI